MKLVHAILLIWTGLFAAGLPAMDADPYPPALPERGLRFYSLKGQLDVPTATEALETFGAQIVYGPKSAASQTTREFVALSVPFSADKKKIERALKKGGVKVEALVCICFDGRSGQESALPNFGTGQSGQDHILGMSGDIRWYDSADGWTQFYGPAKKLKPEELTKRYQKLFEPYGGGTLGEVVQERILWTLDPPVEERQAKKLVKAIEKLDRVVKARIEGDGALLEVGVELVELDLSGPARAFPGASEADGAGPVRASFWVGPLLELLEKEGLTPGTPEH